MGHPAQDSFALEVTQWSDIPGWFHWREGQQGAVAEFPEGSTFVEVGCYLGRSLCSLADVVRSSGRQYTVIGIDTCRGSGQEGQGNHDAHAPAVEHGGGTLAGLLHRNIIACGFADTVDVMISSSPRAANFFADGSLTWVHLDARHDYDSVVADITAWAPKVAPGGWLSGDDYDEQFWPGVVGAVRDTLPDARPWLTAQWHWHKP
ncbi:class I SAM-dependent methyltransferase [Mycolicibacterium sp. 050158]|jgi:Methyltransferase domain|uniref:class I SAM-dependent methyltransferase n=1 Tax=Mycolicibacterium sp. 050158 TaxID=3090602 RepID=UPI00299E9704|nr:class I SAM-dependent methyltransferase [Mycolicibacterium sp. 050158]MDX1888721.1 class I SAM-dependent methyltransferase [Mycolicibacterium sp. 050158]